MLRRALAIVALCIAAAIAYGIVHDQITARICVEYFTVAHPILIETQSPTVLGLSWGVVATWWVGVLLGVPLAIAACVGSRPRRSTVSLIRPIGKLLAVMAACALVAGVCGAVAGARGWVDLTGAFAARVPAAKHAAFLGVWWAHGASYAVGFAGGIVVIMSVWCSRRALAREV